MERSEEAFLPYVIAEVELLRSSTATIVIRARPKSRSHLISALCVVQDASSEAIVQSPALHPRLHKNHHRQETLV